jgi:hypothetical protein
VIALGKQIMDNWIHDNLVGDETLTTSPLGYTNDIIIIEYLKHLVKHISPSLEKPWKILLLDNHITYLYPEFIIEAAKFHIVVFLRILHMLFSLLTLASFGHRNIIITKQFNMQFEALILNIRLLPSFETC